MQGDEFKVTLTKH